MCERDSQIKYKILGLSIREIKLLLTEMGNAVGGGLRRMIKSSFVGYLTLRCQLDIYLRCQRDCWIY